MRMFHHKINIFIGHYGVGKTTLAVNLASETKKNFAGSVSVADIDVNNPYFRSRDWAEKLAASGITVIMPEQEIAFAEMPFLPKQIYAALQKEGKVFLDVGGNAAGTTVLGSLADHLKHLDFQLWFVANIFRPDMETVEEMEAMFDRLEALARLKVSGIINNSNLAEWTTAEHVMESEKLVYQFAERKGITDYYNAVEDTLAGDLAGKLRMPAIPIRRLDRLVWQGNGGLDDGETKECICND